MYTKVEDKLDEIDIDKRLILRKNVVVKRKANYHSTMF